MIAEMSEYNRLFLGVESSATGRAWRDRLDERGAARALAIAQRHDIPELLARILAGRNVEVDAVEAFLDPTIKRLDARSRTCSPPCRRRRRGIADAVDARRDRRDLRRLRRRRRDLGGAAGALSAPRPASSRSIHIPDRLFEGYGPNVEAVRALAARGATLLVTVDCGTTSIEPLARSARARPRCRRHRSSSGRRGAAAGAGHRQSEPARRSFRPRPSRRRRARVHDRGGGQPRAARARLLDRGAARARSARRSSTTSRSAPSPTWCR